MAVPRAKLSHLQRALHQPVMLYEHSCCGSVRWSGARCCDQCGAWSELRVWNISLGRAMARLHRHDVAPPAQATPLPAPEPQPPAAPAAPLTAPQDRPLLANVRPPGARPHRWDGSEEEASIPVATMPVTSGIGPSGVAVGLPLIGIAVLLVGGWDHRLMPPLIGVAAILFILCVPLVTSDRADD